MVQPMVHHGKVTMWWEGYRQEESKLRLERGRQDGVRAKCHGTT